MAENLLTGLNFETKQNSHKSYHQRISAAGTEATEASSQIR